MKRYKEFTRLLIYNREVLYELGALIISLSEFIVQYLWNTT